MKLTINSTPRIIFLAGPTGSGKSAKAIELAHNFDAEIVGADAYQVYTGMPILTAMPTPQQRSMVTHHLLEVISPAQEWDAATHALMANDCIQDILQRGKSALVVGGSGLYLKFISHGIAPSPPACPQLRSTFATLTLQELIDQLRALDPEALSLTDLSNRRYVERNLEIVSLSKLPLRTWRQNWTNARPRGEGYYLQIPTQELDERITQRTHAMMQAGVVEEVSALLTQFEQGQTLSITAQRTLGLAEIHRHIDGEISAQECADLISLRTRQYAKRQRTWLRREAWLRPL